MPIDHRTFVTAVRTVVLRSGARRKCRRFTATRPYGRGASLRTTSSDLIQDEPVIAIVAKRTRAPHGRLPILGGRIQALR
jgi:hypothetical protein